MKKVFLVSSIVVFVFISSNLFSQSAQGTPVILNSSCSADCAFTSCSVNCQMVAGSGGGGAVCTCAWGFATCACGGGGTGAKISCSREQLANIEEAVSVISKFTSEEASPLLGKFKEFQKSAISGDSENLSKLTTELPKLIEALPSEEQRIFKSLTEK